MLLDHARSASDGMRLLETAGAGGVSSRVRRPLGPARRRPASRRRAPGASSRRATGALALGPPAPGDRFTVSAATLGLLAAAAEEGPSSASPTTPRLDAESLEALLFVARRVGAEGIALILARDDVSQRLEDAPLPRLRLSGLAHADAAELVARSAQADAAPPVVEALVAGAAGNPLALVEAAAALTPRQLAGTEPLGPAPGGAVPPRRAPTAGAGAARADAAGAAGRQRGRRGGRLPHCRARGGGLAIADLEPAERAGVIAVGPTWARFCTRSSGRGLPIRRRPRTTGRAPRAPRPPRSARAPRPARLAPRPGRHRSRRARRGRARRRGGRAMARNSHAAACEAFETAARLTQGGPRGRRLLPRA